MKWRFLLCVLLCHQAMSAQQNRWTGNGDGITWEDAANWSGGRPDIDDDVLIDSGDSVVCTSIVEISSLDIEQSVLRFDRTLDVQDTAFFDTSSKIYWDGGPIVTGTFINQGVIDQNNLTANPQIALNTVLINEGEINLLDQTWGINGRLENLTAGSLFLKSPDNLISGSIQGEIINYGLIEKCCNNGSISIFTKIIQEGQLICSQGELIIDNANTECRDGVYGSELDATLRLKNISVDGDVTIAGSGKYVADGDWIFLDDSSLDFTGNTLEWQRNRWSGTGEVDLYGTLALANTSFLRIESGVQLRSHDTLAFNTSGQLYVQDTIKNMFSSLIIFNDAGQLTTFGGGHLMNNGIIENSHTGTSLIRIPVDNEGILDASSGTLEITDTFNSLTGTSLQGDGIINLPTGTVVNIFDNISPGNSPGILQVDADIEFQPSSTLVTEINGASAGSTYDQLDVDGTVIMESIDAVLGYHPAISDSFILVTASNGINCDALPSTITLPYNGTDYIYDVDCSNGNNLVLRNTALLPVELAYFNVVYKNKEVNCSWQTITELNTSHFILERSYDAIHFESITKMVANGNSFRPLDYSWTDQDVGVATKLYYRLKSVDQDGTYYYSQVHAITLNQNAAFTFWPNPIQVGQHLQIKKDGALEDLRLISITGHEFTLSRSVQGYLIPPMIVPGLYKILSGDRILGSCMIAK